MKYEIKDRPLVSIRLMTFNHSAYIEQALQSIDMQKTNFDFEVVIGDDFSTDENLDLIKEYQFLNGKITINILKRSVGDAYYLQRKKLGRLYNFVNILNNCKGKYIALLDGDDYWTDPLKLQKQVDFLEGNPGYSICFHNVKLFNQETGNFEKDTATRKVSESTSIIDLANGNYIHTPSAVLRNDFEIPTWFDKVHLGDWSLYMLSVNDRKIFKFPEEMSVYRIHDQSIWSKKTKHYKIENTLKSFCLINESLSIPKEVSIELKKKIDFYNRQLLELSK